MLPDTVRDMIEAAVGAVRDARPVGGGDVSAAARVETAAGAVFAKWAGGAAGQTYAAEAEGLTALAEAAPPDLVVPAPLAVRTAEAGVPGVLVLPWIERGRPTARDWRQFGEALAAMHRADAPGDGYGWPADNWIGSKPQRNGWHASWPAFVGEQRLRAAAEVVRARGAWERAWGPLLDRTVARLGEVLPEAPPRSVLHGDLWAGNAVPTADGRFALIDPAVSVGHREADLAMTELFGGFDRAFYDGYYAAWPVEPGAEARRAVYQLFHLINHLTHGSGYAAPVEKTLHRFGS